MPSEAFIKAASAANREPVVLLAIESIDAIRKEVTIQADWEAGSLTNINTTLEPGIIRLVTDDLEATSGTYSEPVIISEVSSPEGVYANYGGVYLTRTETPVFATGERITRISISGVISEGWNFSGRVALFDRPAALILFGRLNGGSWLEIPCVFNFIDNHPVFQFNIISAPVTRGSWEFKIRMESQYQQNDFPMWVLVQNYQLTHETHYLPTGSLTTPPDLLDLGSVPTVNSRFEVTDVEDTGCTIAYTAWGRNSPGDSWSALGAIVDGGTLAPFRYYQINAALTASADGMNTPTISEIRIIGGDSQYTYLSTHQNIPVKGALPYIAPGGISSISSRIDLTQQATVGELTAKLLWRPKVGDIIAGDYLKNKNIICKLGFVGLSEVDYEPYFVGTWYDYQSDHEKGIITVKTRNVLKRFTRKIPAAGYFMASDGVTRDQTKTKTYSGNVMAVMLVLADELGIPDRYINRATFTALATGNRGGSTPPPIPPATTPAGSPGYVTRTLTEPTDAMEMLNELAVSAGVFLFEGPDGKLTAKAYDDFASAEPVATLDAVHCKFRPVDGGQKDLSTRQAIYYQLLPGADNDSSSSYGKLHLEVNQSAEIAWFGDVPEEQLRSANTREWKDKWGISVTAVQLLAKRWDSWFAVPRPTVRVDDVPPRLYGIERGQIVAVDNLQLVCPEEDWQGYTNGTRFLVMGKSISDPTSGNLTVSFDLMQLEAPEFTIDPSFPDYSRLDFWPEVTALTLTPQISTGNAISNTKVGISIAWGTTTSGRLMRHEVQYRQLGGEWFPSLSPPGSELVLPELPAGTYEVRVRSAYGNNYFSDWITSIVVVPPPDSNAPVVPGNDLYDTAQLRNILFSTSEPTENSVGNNGDIWITYIP